MLFGLTRDDLGLMSALEIISDDPLSEAVVFGDLRSEDDDKGLDPQAYARLLIAGGMTSP
jgi:hypothetical protein